MSMAKDSTGFLKAAEERESRERERERETVNIFGGIVGFGRLVTGKVSTKGFGRLVAAVSRPRAHALAT